MTHKRCFKCKAVKAIAEFYKHSAMADGYLGKCKSCTKDDVQRHYRATQEARFKYERERSQRPERRAAAARYQAKRREQRPEEYRARMAVGNAVRDGRLAKLPCEVCGNTDSQAHHDDYSKPLDVRWLCFFHHRELHGQKPAKRA